MRPLWWLSVGFGLSCATVAETQRAPEPSEVVATFGERQIRLQEVDAHIARELGPLQERVFELRKEAAEAIALEAIIAQKAKAQGVSGDDWVQQQLGEKGHGEDDVGRRARALFSRLREEARFQLRLQAPEKRRISVRAVGPSKGSASAKVTIVEFADFECGFCARAHRTLERVLAQYEGQVRLVFRHYPLSFHERALPAASASVCADAQDKFWAFHDSLFDSGALDDEALEIQAMRVGIDVESYRQCLASARADAMIQRDMAEAAQAGVRGTPAFFINGLPLQGAQPEEAFRKVIDAELRQ